MSALTVLRGYAQKSDPNTLPLSIRLTHTTDTLTVFDAYPKSIFHFLVLPRIVPPLTASNLSNLRSLLKCDKNLARKVLEKLNRDAQGVRAMIEDEMVKRYGFKWGIWTGFHAIPSMEHLHLHVLSNDLCSPAMKKKKHYNSFHPSHGFFLPLEDVLNWFDAHESYFSTQGTGQERRFEENFLITLQISRLWPSQYDPMLKEPLVCWRCYKELKNIPTLKAHLQTEWDDEAKREKARVERKRKRDDEVNAENASGDTNRVAKKRDTASP
ncbi:uncharacterized protein FIBRA_04509 [Fibroporia radiculosa]|uniref:Aprataxin C2HE/C2H2/C2HC zinc finger domain-containing protein n=1 Tax=Fibroporia radiculosa TaxID=599839 RepID=J4IA73_9APHY|nr:uncharacterized protein FIBRA_04509 [Fibroporia radiculosa]CCM02411.1 predicted protein [Fibroporia radiculosa]